MLVVHIHVTVNWSVNWGVCCLYLRICLLFVSSDGSGGRRQDRAGHRAGRNAGLCRLRHHTGQDAPLQVCPAVKCAPT